MLSLSLLIESKNIGFCRKSIKDFELNSSFSLMISELKKVPMVLLRPDSSTFYDLTNISLIWESSF